ncbi:MULTISPECIES: SPOR domain-containing protein [Providencia]|uniref:SPOR domain-containing protein n=1 Tax=Providencia TaxID=586 RepID=UPI001E3D4286|nr:MULTISPECIES: SPOR domain-containing protein [Providencia]
MIFTHHHWSFPLLLMGISLLLCRPALSVTSPTSLEQIHDLGVQSINGDGVPIDLAKGRYYIQQSALQGYPLGQYHLGILFFTGEGGPQNSVCATWWLEKAIDANNEVRERAQQALNDIQEDIVITTKVVDEQRCQQYSYNLISLPIAKPAQTEPQVNAIELSAEENHALLEALKNRQPHRIYTTLRRLQNALTKIWQPIAEHRERLMLAAAHKAHTQQQTIPAENKTVSDEPTEVIIPLVLPPSEQKGKTERVESMSIDMPSKPIEETIPATKNASVHTNLGGDIRSAAPRHYTLQLGSAGSAEGLYDRARRHKLSNYLVYEAIRNGQQWYVLVYGEYPTMSAAKQALIALPRGLQKDKPWVRSLKHVQSELH